MNHSREVFGSQRGASLLIALITLVLLSALGLSLSLVMDTEVRIASNFAASREALYTADGALEIAAQELLSVSDWNDVLDGSTRSVFVDGAPSGSRQLRDGRSIDLADVTTRANGEPRPWGANNPRWQLFAYGPLGGTYVIVWAGDDPAETDGDPGRDDVPGNPGAGIVALRAEDFGADRAHTVLEATARRSTAASGTTTLEMLSWQHIR